MAGLLILLRRCACNEDEGGPFFAGTGLGLLCV